MCAPLGDDRRVGDDASFYPVPWRLTILISPPTPAPYRYTGLGLVRLIIRSSSGIRLHKQKAQRRLGSEILEWPVLVSGFMAAGSPFRHPI